MSIIYSFLNFVFGAFTSVWSALNLVWSTLSAALGSLTDVFLGIFEHLGIYDVLIDFIDELTNLFQQLNTLVSVEDSFAGTLASFFALDSLFSVFVSCVSATFGVLLVMLSIVFVTVVPTFFVWISIKGGLRLIKFLTGGVVDA